jgi:RNA polymerase sigma-70 factor, ECF subfamily
MTIMSENPSAEHGQWFNQYCREDDIAAFERLMNVYNTPLFNYLVRLLRSREEAEDALQEVWLKVIRQKNTYKEQGQFSSWLYRIAHNCYLDICRKNACRTKNKEIVENDEGFAYLDIIPDTNANPYEMAVENEMETQLEQEVAKLPERIREVYILRAIHGIAFKEIAEIQDSPMGTVLSRMHQAVKQLAPVLRVMTDNSQTHETA